MKDPLKIFGIVLMGVSAPMIFASMYLGITTLNIEYIYGVGLFSFSSFMGYFTYSAPPISSLTGE